ncbi:MAG: glycosyltransferase family 2 protein [Candidatus Melainabacteria bacterium]|nr:glycosyltransferase family 2 protein [Candidatus Melainabacteria bacterium]
MYKPQLSVALITFNEERIIEKTISAIHNWVDEIVVVDSFSTDKTLNILEMFNVTLYTEEWKGYAAQKNFALSKCKSDWILVLDADEIVSNALKNEIINVVGEHSNKIGFKIKRKLYVGKRWIKYGGYYPDYQLRFFKNNIGAHFKKREIHESISLEGEIGYLKNPLEHYAYKDLKDYKKTLEKYAELASKEVKNKKFYLPPLRASWAFFFRYIVRLGFLEGKLGFDLANAYSNYVYKKYELARK